MEAKETQGEKFFSILKKTGYAGREKLSAKNFEYLFSIPDTSAFFNWFIANVDENCVLAKEDLDKFNQKAANNQVIYDLDRLEGLNTLINSKINQSGDKLSSSSKNFYEKLADKLNSDECQESSDESEIEAMKREIELQERELNILNKQIQFQRLQKRQLSEKLLMQKTKKSVNQGLSDETSSEFESIKKTSKQSLHNLNKNLCEFQALLGNDEKLAKENNLFNLGDEETCVNAYVSQERDFLKTVQEILSVDIDVDNLKSFPSNSNAPNESREEKLRDELYLINKCYPKLLLKYRNCKIENEIQAYFYQVMEKICENPSEFFQFNFSEFQEPCAEMKTSERKLYALSEKQCQSIQEGMARFDDKTEKINANCRSYTDLLDEKTKKFTRLRLLNLFQRNVIKNELDLRLTLIKQDEIMRVMHNQKSRIEFLKQFQSAKLNKIETLKVSFEEIIARGNALISLISNMSRQKNSSQTQLASLSTSNFLTSTMISTNYNNNNNTSITNTSMYLGSPQGRFREKSRFPPYTTAASFSFTDFNCIEESIHVNLLNQVLIQILKHIQSDFDHVISLKKPVSINLNDNLANFAHLINAVDSMCEQKRKQWLSKSMHVENLLNRSIEYLYEKDENSNKINIKMPKCLEEMLKKCSEKSKEIKCLYVEKIFKPYTNYMKQLDQNKLIQLKRKFFIHFYNYDGEKINHIMEQLNAMVNE
jgi:hypothetical protein